MTYKFLNASLSSIDISGDPKTRYINFFQEAINRQFYNTSDWYTIQEQTSIGSTTYQNIDVRINRMIDATTGKNMSDDFKRLLFKDLSHSVDLGRYFYFDNNYWIVFDIEKIKTLNNTVNVRRCNNTLRFIDANGVYHSIPCVIDYLIKENRDYATAGSSIMVPSGTLEMMVQSNSESNLICANQRFLFGTTGNWTCYKIPGGGIANFNNSITTNNASQGLIRLTAITSFVNEQVDDITNGIADVYKNVYTVVLNDNVIAGQVGGNTTLIPIITFNGETISKTVTWLSSNTAVATVNAGGMVSYIGVGTAVITCHLAGNETIYDTCNITVSAVPQTDYRVVVSPITNYLLEGQTETYSVYLNKNNVPEIDSFTFAVIGNGVPSANYTITNLNGNQFRLKNNKMHVSEPLVIRATPNFHTEYVKDISIQLKGAW